MWGAIVLIMTSFLGIFALSKFGLYSTCAIVRCMQYRVMLNSFISRIGYIIQQCDCWCTSRPRQNGRHFADAMLKFIFLKIERGLFFIEISMTCVARSLIDNNSALVQVTAWRQTSHYLNHWWPRLPTHICISRPQWVNSLLALFLLTPQNWMTFFHQIFDVIWSMDTTSLLIIQVC